MSTNIYRYCERIFFNDKKPTECWGWYLSTSSDYVSATWFSSKKAQNKFLKKVQNKLRDFESKHRVTIENPSGYWGEWQACYVACLIVTPTDEWMLDELRTKIQPYLVDYLTELALDNDIRAIAS